MTRDTRFDFVTEKILDAFPKLEPSYVNTFLETASVQPHIQLFLDGQEPHKLLFIYHPNPTNLSASTLTLDVSDKKLTLADKAVYIIRKKPESIPAKEPHLAVIAGIMDQNSLQTFQALLEEVYIPYFNSAAKSLNETSGNQLREFISVAEKFKEKLGESISSKTGTAQLLSCPDTQFIIANNQKDIRESLNNSELVSHYEGMCLL
jgi:hypothetical protein